MAKTTAIIKEPMFALLGALETVGDFFHLVVQTVYWVVVGPLSRRTRFHQLVPPLLYQVGVRSLGIVVLISTLVGGILVLQTADKFEEFGSKELVPSMVAVAVIRELGPLMTAIVMAGRVGAAFTAGLGSMVINEEKLALETMGINPVGYLVAPRFIAMSIMMPCLTVFSYLVGITGGVLVGVFFYQIDFWTYYQATKAFTSQVDICLGLLKSLVFGTIICMVACQCAFRVRGGPEGVGRNTMKSVVLSLVAIVAADGLMTISFAKFIYPYMD